MPSRLATAVIVLCWLATMAWFFQRDVWPRIRPGDPPPFVPDLSDEVQHNAPIRWLVYRDADMKKFLGRLQTSVRYHKDDDSFELKSEFTQKEPWLLLGHDSVFMNTTERVTRDGDLRKVTAELRLKLTADPIVLRLDGQVTDGQLHAQIRLNDADLPVKPVPVVNRSSMVLPLHPVNRIAGLRPGQQWQVSMVNPLSDLLRAAAENYLPGIDAIMPAAKPAAMTAEVLPQRVEFSWAGRTVKCWIIEYRGDDETARTYVLSAPERQEDGLVLRQEARRGDDVVILQREQIPDGPHD
jgi:hypothetical protein